MVLRCTSQNEYLGLCRCCWKQLRLAVSSLVVMTSAVATGRAENTTGPPGARAARFGLGIALIDPTGLSANVRLSPTQSIEGAVGWGRHSLTLHGQLLLDEVAVTRERSFDLGLVYGVGARLAVRASDSSLGIRVPAGLLMTLRMVPMDVFGQLGLVVRLVPSTGAELEATLGTRYYFD